MDEANDHIGAAVAVGIPWETTETGLVQWKLVDWTVEDDDGASCPCSTIALGTIRSSGAATTRSRTCRPAAGSFLMARRLTMQVWPPRSRDEAPSIDVDA